MIQHRHTISLRDRIVARNQERRRQAMADRIAEAERDSQRLLLHRARQLGITAEPDTIKPGSWITRAGRARARVNLTSPTDCTCSEFGIFHRCPCRALVIDLTKAQPGPIVRLHIDLERAA